MSRSYTVLAAALVGVAGLAGGARLLAVDGEQSAVDVAPVVTSPVATEPAPLSRSPLPTRSG